MLLPPKEYASLRSRWQLRAYIAELNAKHSGSHCSAGIKLKHGESGRMSQGMTE